MGDTRLRRNYGHQNPATLTRKLPSLAACFLALLCLIASPPPYAQAESSLVESFRAAAQRWNLPAGFLMAIGYVETRWEQHPGDTLDGGVGLMHLIPGEGGTLTRAIALTKLSETELRESYAANIEGAAAVLSDILSDISPKISKQQEIDWKKALARYSGLTDPAVAESYAHDVLTVWREGRTLKISSGETVTLVGDGRIAAHAPERAAPDSLDYPPAQWVAANPANYTVGRPYGPTNFIVIHDTEGSYYSAINWFQNPNARVSAHYVIRSSDGQITQMVRERDTAWHAGNWDYNVRSYGIEHEGYMNQPGWYTEAMYQSSAALSRHLADTYSLKKDRAHVIAHSEVPGATHQDPGPYWNWNYYMSLVRRDWAYSARVDNTDPAFAPIPSVIDPQYAWWTHPNGYGGSNTYVTRSALTQADSTNSATWTATIGTAGYHDVYAYIPWVDNNTPDTSAARYRITALDGDHTVTVSQRGITDRGTGGWAHLGAFYLDSYAQARVYLDDFTGETGRNVWFDAVMWIPTTGGPPPPPPATATRTPSRTATPIRTPTRTPTRTRTPLPSATPTRTNTPMPTWTPGPCGMRFTDLPNTHWTYPHISYLFCGGIVAGYEDGTFRPHLDSTRGQFVKMLALGMGWNLYFPVTPTFNDVGPSSPFYPYIETAYLYEVVSGYPDGSFRPNNPLTRAQAAKMLVIAKGWPPLYPPQPSFTDVAPSEWPYPYIEAATSRGVIGGYEDRTFRPHLHVTRAQLSKMLALTLQSPP